MKKVLLCALLCLVLAGCGNTSDSDPTTAEITGGYKANDQTTATDPSHILHELLPADAVSAEFLGIRCATDMSALTMTAKQVVYPPDAVRVPVCIENASEESICTFGNNYELQRWNGETWVDVDASVSFYWNEIAYESHPGQTNTLYFSLEGYPVEDGYYRFRLPITFRYSDGGETMTGRYACAAFEISASGEDSLSAKFGKEVLWPVKK